MSIAFGNPDRPNSYIGKTMPRPNAARLVEGRGRYVDDIVLPRMVHVAFVRSHFAHARITSIDTAAAKEVRGVLRVFTGADLAKVCTPWVAVLAHLKGLKSPPEHPMALDRACWVGEPVVASPASSAAGLPPLTAPLPAVAAGALPPLAAAAAFGSALAPAPASALSEAST